jgi:hypothetical protein
MVLFFTIEHKQSRTLRPLKAIGEVQTVIIVMHPFLLYILPQVLLHGNRYRVWVFPAVYPVR